MTENIEQTEEKGGTKKKLFILVGIVALLLLIGGGIAGYFLLKKPESTPEETDPGAQVPVPDLEAQTTIGPMVNIEEFIVNIISADNPHYVKASLTVELSNEKVQPEFEQRMPQVRDAILLLVGNKTYEELQDLHGKKQLKAELTSKLNSFLQGGKVKSIYFTNFVVQ